MSLPREASRRSIVGCVALVTACAVVGCSGDEKRAPGLGDCTGELCSPSGGSSSTLPEAGIDAAADASGLDAVGEVNLSGRVVVFRDDTFEMSEPYPGSGTLRFPTLAGDDVVPFGGDADPGFAAVGVRAGAGWFAVVPGPNPPYDAMSTWAFLVVPAEGSRAFDVPVLTRSRLASIFLTLSGNPTLRADAAQVVVVFERNGVREPGVFFTSVPTSDWVAFDMGAGFSSEFQATGVAGVALLVNVTGAGALSWSTGAGRSGSMTLVHVAGQLSFVRIDVEG
ncbi:MAG: hypothetical protein MUF54_23990 [Polyangiaceae bacterium]|jgi:hypothetical protein|nr:hypothetical protein [Polyangiaceae bacterium]